MDIAEPHGLKDALHKQHWNLYWECQQCPYIWSWCLSDMESGRTVISPYLSKCPLDGPSFQWGWSLVEAHTKQLTKSYKFALPPVRIGTACFCLGINQSPPLPSGFSKMSQGDWRRKLTWIQIIFSPRMDIFQFKETSRFLFGSLCRCFISKRWKSSRVSREEKTWSFNKRL